MFGGGGPTLGYHSDVLSADPQDNESKLRLVEELKSRAKSDISNKNFPTACALYRKALEIFPRGGNSAAELAILHANLSMVQSNMTLFDEALVNADEAVKLDPTYTKGFFRQSSALIGLKRFQDAKQALLKGLELKVDDKDLKSQLAKVESEIATRQTTISSTTTTSTTTTTTTTTAASASVPISNKKNVDKTQVKTETQTQTQVEMEMEVMSDETGESGETFRGYKKTSDGRVTTFFNHEMDEETKKLIGDIAPKKIDSASIPVLTSNGSGTGSAWNTAGTFESIGHTKWAHDRLREMLKLVSVKNEENTVAVAVTAVTDIVGDAEVTMLRGKRKHICDLSVTLQWIITNLPSQTEVKGDLVISDITADEDYEFASFSVSTADPLSLVATHVRADRSAFKIALVKALHTFLAEFKLK